jgi:Flp pilus assembly protein TadG
MALLLPVLTFLVIVAVDFGRAFYYQVTITNCARNGALYASDPASPLRNTYTDYKQAAIADGQNLNPPLTTNQVSSTSGTDGYGSYVEVTVQYSFSTVTSYLGFNSVSLSRKVRMRVPQVVPD